MIEKKALKYPPLFEIPVTGDEASEVGADYTKLRDFLKNKEYGKADLETARKILWVAKRDNLGWLDVRDIENFPSQDLRTINQLWLAASKARFGFSVQKQIWIDLGGKPGQYDHNVFIRFIEKVEWARNQAICFDQRAAKGHLPLGMYVKVRVGDVTMERRWVEKTDKIKEKELEEKDLEIERLKRLEERMKEEIERLKREMEKILLEREETDWAPEIEATCWLEKETEAKSDGRGGPGPSLEYGGYGNQYLFLLSRKDL